MAKKASKTFRITGRVIDSATQQGIAGLQVEAWDKDLICNDLVGSTATDEQGAFQIAFTEAHFKELFLDRQPDLFFKVFREDELIKSTEDSVLWNVAAGNTEVVIEVAIPAASKPEETFVVRGKVRDADGNPVAGAIVRAYNKDLRSEEEPQGEPTFTDKDGRYEIPYSADQFRRAKKLSADLVVKAFAADGLPPATSEVLYNAPPVAEVDLTISAEVLQPPTLFEKIGRELAPLLEGLRVEELEEDKQHQNLSFLSGKTGFEKNLLVRFVMAHKLAQHCIQAEFWFALLGGSFFQFVENQSLKEQVAALLDSLSSLDAAAVRKALIRAFNQKELPEAFRENVDGWVEAFLKFTASHAVSGAAKPTFVKLALEHASIEGAEKQEKFARLFNEHKALTPELLATLEKDKSFKKTEIADLQTSFQLTELTRGDFSVVKMLKEEFDVRQPEKIRTLAKKSESEWVSLVKEKHAAGEIKLPIEVGEIAGQIEFPAAEVYGKTLERQFREAFPTTAFAGGLERAIQKGGAHGLRHAEALGRFLDGHENFELLNTPVDDFLQDHAQPDFRALAEDENFKLEVKAVQRVFKLAPTFEATDAMLADGVHSAQMAYRMGESEFVRSYADRPGFTKESAELAWNRAADTYAGVLTLYGDLISLNVEGLPESLKNGNEVLSTFPNWNNLFKTGDFCECEHCRSVLGPAAYFADLLMFLKDRKSKKLKPDGIKQYSTKDILFARRSDLGFLELNCANGLTRLPYIDVVCEVLENAVDAARENDLELKVLAAAPGVDLETAFKKVFKDAFTDLLNDGKEKIELGDNFSFSQVNPIQSVVHTDNVTYLLEKRARLLPQPFARIHARETTSLFAEILRNTKASAAELRAYPQYVNPKAYGKLKSARYPLALPFDLFNEEVRAAFQKVAVKRWELMRTFKGTVAPNNPTDGDIAAEYFGISVGPAGTTDEKRIILGANVPNQHEFWGETATSLIANVGKVNMFLQKTGLEYTQLLALLDLKFIKPAGERIDIIHLDSTCDTEKKRIEILDAPKLDRIHRFLRLWRKLKGLKMWELDLIIGHPAIGKKSLDEPFLVKLMYFTEVKNKLGEKVTVEQTAALFGNLNTETRFTKLHEKREDALYQYLFLNKKLIHPLDPAFQLDPVTGDLPAGQTITAHQPVVQAALGMREADLLIFKNLTKPSGSHYINDDLNLANLSFLWRHAWLAKVLQFKAEEWKILLKLFQQDISAFANPQAAWDFLERVGRLKNTGFNADELNWLLAADHSAKAAVKETDAAKFLFELRKALQAIRSEFDASQFRFLAPPTDEKQLSGLLTTLLQKLNRNESEMNFFLATLSGEVSVTTKVAGVGGLVFPPGIPIKYDTASQTLRFNGVMTRTQQTTLNGVLANPTYQAAIKDLFDQPRLAVKCFEPVFTAPLEILPPAIDFKAQLPADLAAKISYDAESRLLRFNGIMTKKEQLALDALAPSVTPIQIAYHNAVSSLAAQPQTPPANKLIWLTDTDLDQPTSLATDTAAKRMANAIGKALAFLSKAFAETEVVQQCSEALGLTQQVTRKIVETFKLFPPPIASALQFFTDTTSPSAFSRTINAIDYAGSKNAFDTWYWLNRVATILKKWKITLEEFEIIIPLQTPAQLLDFKTLLLNSTTAVAPIDAFLRTNQLLKLRDTLPETALTLLEVLEKLNRGAYGTTPPFKIKEFAADVQQINEEWNAADVERLIQTLDLTFPTAYLLAENWERLRDAFRFLEKLNAGTDKAVILANPIVGKTESDTLKQLLRSKFGTETWLALSIEIQDVLRERKRDALVAYLLTKPSADAPSDKWENTNDLYAYYLLDVEMSSCQLTSRLVQASGSVQLFVQRCFMGLEPDVVVQADDTNGTKGDSAWRWWKWMRKYQVWVANREVFLRPEIYIEPELRKDKSPFFKDMENELLQNEVNQYTVETAFSNYLEKLNGVAHLEIAGFFQEDDGDNTIVHVFGRTAGAEPHLYYYRRYDYRQWTPWEKVELDIQGNYLIPAVVNKRLFLFWPVFTEVPDEAGNSRVTVPQPGETSFTPDKTKKRLRLQMAVSEYRQGKWTAKKVSTDFDESGTYDVEIVRQHYRFFAIDRSNEVGGSFSIRYAGDSVWSAAAAQKTIGDLEAAAEAAKEKENTARGKKTDADKTLKDAKDAVLLVQLAVDFAKRLIPIADNIVATSKDLIKNVGDVYNSVFHPTAASHASLTYGKADEAKQAVKKAAGLTAIATDRATTFFNTIGGLDQAFRAVESRAVALKKYYDNNDTLNPLRYLNKGNLPTLALVAQDAATYANSAGTVAINAIQSFRDDAITTAGTAEKKLNEAIALAAAAAEAKTNFKFDDNKRAHLSGAFEISGCTGVPALVPKLIRLSEKFMHAIRPERDSTGDDTSFMKWVELGTQSGKLRFDNPQDDLALKGVLGYLSSTPVLKKTPGFFKITPPWQSSYLDKMESIIINSSGQHRPTGGWLPFFYNDKKRTFLIMPSIKKELIDATVNGGYFYYPGVKSFVRQNLKDYGVTPSWIRMVQEFHFKNFYHPFVCDFAKLVYNPLKGIPALMSRETQSKDTTFFEEDYAPEVAVVKLPRQYPLLPDCYPREVVDFTPDGAYSPYNWELFFHAPLMIANSLSKNQRFEEARDWYHFIFNPIGVESGTPGGSPMSKYWITKPFFETTNSEYIQQRIDNIMRMLAGETTLQNYSQQAKKDLEDQVFDWRTNPFEPHRIANYRTVAYQKTVVMKYLDNLVAWGDNLFRQESMENINEATQLYILAAEILGPRPKRVPPQVKPPLESFNELETEFDKFSNALIEVENLVPPLPGNRFDHTFGTDDRRVTGADRPPLPMLYFCIPRNDKMLGYWDTVADRLYKIRHCMNIEGVVRQLALFEPPIDPGALVKAIAGGVDINSALADLNAPLPLYRFNVLLPKANEVCNDVKALGGALLAALEKKDAEAMGLLRQTQEIRLLQAVKAVREKQIEEAKENLEGTKKSKIITETRREYYRDIEKIALGEQLSLDKQETAFGHQEKAQQYNITASVLGYIPNITIGVSGIGGSPHVNAQLGTGNIISALQAAAGSQTQLSNAASFEAGRASTLAGYDRRFEDWKLQERLADKELDHIAKQIAAAELRIAIAEKELDNHVIQIENAKATDAFMRSKYTNQELYQWQVGQISGVYFQSYKLAYDLAKRAERCFRFELGLQDSSYINFGYWDSLKKGLLSGEKLQYDLRRLETAYLEQNRREFELTKHVSLTLLDPLALVKLRETGRCFFHLPEEIFDLDYPGHYFRRIRSVSLTLPCVVGPYATISCTLRLLKNSIRINTANGDNSYPRNADAQGLPADDSRFIENNIPVKSIAASNAQNDSGVFELSFRDERYLPFEGAGAVSEWALELFNDNTSDFGKSLRQFDYKTISDAILHVKYTAREDAGPFKNGAVTHLRNYFDQAGSTHSLRMFNLRQEFPTQWHRFLNPTNRTTGNVFELEMLPSLFPIRDAGKTLRVNTIWLLARCTNAGSYSVVITPPVGSNTMPLAKINQYGGLHFAQKGDAQNPLGIAIVPTGPPVTWKLEMTRPGGNLQVEVEDMLLVVGYEW